MSENILSQDEINKLGINQKLTLADEIKNLIILSKNELTILEKTVDKYPEIGQKKIKKKLNKLLTKIIGIRK